MAGFISKASSFLSSQTNDQKVPSHGGKAGSNEEEYTGDARSSSDGYGNLLAGAHELISSVKPSDGELVDKEKHSHNAPASSGSAAGYGNLRQSEQSSMGITEPSAVGGGKPDIKKQGDGVADKALESGGYGDLLKNAQEIMGSTKLGSDESEKVADASKTALSSGNHPGAGDMHSSMQVLMGAVKATHEGGAVDMGEVAGATADLIGAGTRYADLKNTAYGEYAHKAQTYLQEYEASHGKEAHKLPSSANDQESSPLPEVGKPQTPLKSGGNDEEKVEVGTTPSVKKFNG